MRIGNIHAGRVAATIAAALRLKIRKSTTMLYLLIKKVLRYSENIPKTGIFYHPFAIAHWREQPSKQPRLFKKELIHQLGAPPASL